MVDERHRVAEVGAVVMADTPPKPPSWIHPTHAVAVVIVAALVILAILGWALVELRVNSGGADGAPVADPNAGTIAAMASAAFTALSSLIAAYFGIKVATEQSAQATATANEAIVVASDRNANVAKAAHDANETALRALNLAQEQAAEVNQTMQTYRNLMSESMISRQATGPEPPPPAGDPVR